MFSTGKSKYMIDTHTHLCDQLFDHDLEMVLDRAKKAGVSAIIAVSEDLEDAEKNLHLAETYEGIYPAAGLYPAILNRDVARKMGRFIKFIRDNKDKLVAIGEVGLDYWVVKDKDARELQRAIFCEFIELSKDLDLPLNVHSRSAGKHTISLLMEYGAEKVQLHAFGGFNHFWLSGVEDPPRVADLSHAGGIPTAKKPLAGTKGNSQFGILE